MYAGCQNRGGLGTRGIFGELQMDHVVPLPTDILQGSH